MFSEIHIQGWEDKFEKTVERSFFAVDDFIIEQSVSRHPSPNDGVTTRAKDRAQTIRDNPVSLIGWASARLLFFDQAAGGFGSFSNVGFGRGCTRV